MSFDIVVIGAGIAGAAAARAAAAEGLSVLVVDAGLPGAASSAGAGIVSPVPVSPAPAQWEPALFAGVAHYRTLPDLLEVADPAEIGLGRVGTTVVAPPEQRALLEELLRRARQAGARHGFDDLGEPDWAGEQEMRHHWPVLATGLIGLTLPGVSRVDARQLCSALLDAARRSGARVERGRAEPDVRGGRARGVRIGSRIVPAGAVIDATGCWSARLPVQTLKGQLVHLRTRDAHLDRSPILQTLGGGYLLGFPEGRVVAGATREPGSGRDPTPTAEGMRAVLEDCLRLAPGLAHAEVWEHRAGLRPVSSDGIPLVGRDPGIDGLVHVGGLGSWGLATGPYLGMLGALTALGQTLPPQAAILDPARFAAGDDSTRSDS
ncbi:NAD(P)/FAD-dependent oxidoreductase [Microbacterium sp.]|uniref:NAD(P)/FAD-dependent oxidoreductase n=1 Tax=Microbacterium sp. TaxID=51671 RepID=UPI003C793896